MNAAWSRVIVVATVLLVPAPALAHGDQFVFMFLQVPPFLAAVALLATMLAWRAERSNKVLAILAAAAVGVVLVGVNWAIQLSYLTFPYGNAAYLAFAGLQLALPGVVLLAWWGWRGGRGGSGRD